MTRVGILISGGGSNMVSLVRDMQNKGYAKPILVISNNPQAAGLQKAKGLGVGTAVVDHRPFKGDRAGFESHLQQELKAQEIDTICLAGFMRILTPEFIQNWAGQMLNIHPSLLPKYPGLNTHVRALEAGDKVAGCTIHEVTADLDAGPILGQAKVPVQPKDTPDDLAARVLIQEHVLYPAVLQRFIRGDRTCIDI